jgi:CheY-like chemotaxis protein
MSDRPRLFLIDDHRVLTDALVGILREKFDFIGTFSRGHDALESLTQLPVSDWPQVVVLDISLPDVNRGGAADQKAASPDRYCFPEYAYRAAVCGIGLSSRWERLRFKAGSGQLPSGSDSGGVEGAAIREPLATADADSDQDAQACDAYTAPIGGLAVDERGQVRQRDCRDFGDFGEDSGVS